MARRFLLILLLQTVAAAQPAASPSISLQESLVPSPIQTLASGFVRIEGSVRNAKVEHVRVRVTTSQGASSYFSPRVQDGKFACRYPHDFAGAAPLKPVLLYVDATDEEDFRHEGSLDHQAEILLVVTDDQGSPPDLPLAFSDDLIDAAGNKDQQSAQFTSYRKLVNQFVEGRSARLMGIGRSHFDLAIPQDLSWFQESMSLYDFDHRDRDWSTPLENRVARGFWQAVWDTWFNPSNDHPWDGNPRNTSPENFRPYTFANDMADLLVLYQMLRDVPPRVPDNRRQLREEVLLNLLAMQHPHPDNFALPDANGKQEHYTAGAFRYGLFESGEWLVEQKGWFANPQFRDFSRGGVFNGRSAWALGESLKASPDGVHAGKVREALRKVIAYCLHDGQSHEYTYRTPSGLPVWSRVAGEHAYLLLGMLAACEVEPQLSILFDDRLPPRSLRDVTIDALDALVEIAAPDGTWTRYANATAMNVAALAEGVRVLGDHPKAAKWKVAAMRGADTWLALRPRPTERRTDSPMFGHRTPEGEMTFFLGKEAHPHVSLYIGGHWLHALAILYDVTEEVRYADRANAILAYYCGHNPLHARLLNELGAIHNRVTDLSGDGIEDTITWDAYPESTAFVQIGLLQLLAAKPAIGKTLADDAPRRSTQLPPDAVMSYLQNENLRIGIDLKRGGAITFLAPIHGNNVVNNFDLGRQIQLSFYSGPVPYQENGQSPSQHWAHLGWNPIQAGDDFGNRSRLLEHTNDGRSLYVRCRPLQWPLNNVPGECTFESWIELEGPVVKVRARLNNARKDKTFHAPRLQELPAVYANATFNRVLSYTGAEPFQGGKVTLIPKAQGKHPWTTWLATEHWSALMNDNDWGLGVITPNRIHFTGGFAGRPGPNATMGNGTGYLASQSEEILDHNIEFEFRYELLLGSLEEVRARARTHHRQSPPTWRFTDDRQGWHYRQATDRGWPIRGELDIVLDQPDPQLISPYAWWHADQAGFLTIEAAIQAPHTTSTLSWQPLADTTFRETNSLSFPIQPDGQYHCYTIDLSRQEHYRGPMVRLRWDPVPAGTPQSWVKVRSIRFTDHPQP